MSEAADKSAPEAEVPRGGVPVWLAVVGTTLAGTALPIALHYSRHGGFNVHQIAMAFFFWLNVIIAYWEICLFFHVDAIREDYESYREKYTGRELDRVIDFFTTRIPVGQLLATRRWADVWASYSLFDESYSNKKSFGFFIDIGNGWTTLLPSLVFIYGITFEFIPARALGILGLIISYQMFYGTVIYLTSFIMNRRYKGHSFFNLAVFVGLSNGLWFVFPIWAMALAVQMIYCNCFGVFTP